MSAAGPCAIVGAGGHGREVLQAVRRAGFDVSAVYDDSESNREPVERLGVRFGGPVGGCELPSFIGIGSGQVRELLDAHLVAASPCIDPSALVGDDVALGDGSVIFAQSTVTTNIAVGRHVHIGRGCAVGHDCVLNDYVSVMPLAGISGNVTVGRGAYIGAGAVIRQGLTIGDGAIIGMGAVVVRDVPAHATVLGNPAEQRR